WPGIAGQLCSWPATGSFGRRLACNAVPFHLSFCDRRLTTMYRVLITDDLSKAGLKILQETRGIEVDVRSGKHTPEQVREYLKEADGIIIRSATRLTPEILKDQPRLKVIVRAGVGVDNIDIPAATREGIVVMNTPAGNTTSTAEQAMALLLAMA